MVTEGPIIMISVTAAFCEELIWRGYVITRLEARGRSRWSAMILATVSFALIHAHHFIGRTRSWLALWPDTITRGSAIWCP